MSSYSGTSESTWVTGGKAPRLSVNSAGSIASVPSCSAQ